MITGSLAYLIVSMESYQYRMADLYWYLNQTSLLVHKLLNLESFLLVTA